MEAGPAPARWDQATQDRIAERWPRLFSAKNPKRAHWLVRALLAYSSSLPTPAETEAEAEIRRLGRELVAAGALHPGEEPAFLDELGLFENRPSAAPLVELADEAETERALLAAAWRAHYRLERLPKGPDGRNEQYALAEAAGRPEAAGVLPGVLKLSQAASRARTPADRDRVRQVARQRPALAALATNLKAQAPALADALADAIIEERERDALDALAGDRPDRTATEWVAALGPEWRPAREALEAAFARATPAELGHLADLKGPVEVDPAAEADALADGLEAEAEAEAEAEEADDADRPLRGRGRVRTSWDPAVWLDAHPDARDLVDFGEADNPASPHPNAADPFERVRRAQPTAPNAADPFERVRRHWPEWASEIEAKAQDEARLTAEARGFGVQHRVWPATDADADLDSPVLCGAPTAGGAPCRRRPKRDGRCWRH